MRIPTFLILIIAYLATSCNSKQEIVLQVTNPLDQQRNDASIVLTRGEITDWIEIPSGKVPVLTLENGIHIPCQLDDINGDGEWDELFAIVDLKPSDQKNILLTMISPEEYPAFNVRTNVRLGANKPGYPELLKADRLEGISFHNYDHVTGAAFQMEGPAWENDLVGFRNYLDQRNGLDIFGKLTSEMILDSVGVAGRQSYHQPDAWGMDVLKVGTSLGSGGIGYRYNDSIYRVGDNGSGTYELLFEGSQRSRINLSFTNWKVEEEVLDVVQQIEIAAGKYYYESLVSYTGSSEILELVPGIVNMKSDTLYVLELNERFSALLTHDHQSEDNTLLAMALMVPSALLNEYGETKEVGEGVTQTYYAALKAQSDQPVPYRFYSLWELEDSRWSSLEEITKFLKSEADCWANEVNIQPLP